MPDNSHIDIAIQNALDGKAVLFLGAGVSNLAKAKSGEPLPLASKLSQLLAEDLNIDRKDYTLSALAQHYRKVRGAHGLLAFLQRRLLVGEIPSDLADFLSIAWRRIYTTNYDDLVETARPKEKSFSVRDDPSGVAFGSLVHLNGSIGQASIHSLDNDLVLTDWSYANSELFGSKWLSQFAADVYSASSVLFVGYSLRDLDITRALLRDSTLAARTVIVASEHDDPIETNLLDDYGTVYRTGTTYLFARCKQARKAPVSSQPPLLDSFHYLTAGHLDLGKGGERTEVLFDQFVYGRVDESRVLQPALPKDAVSIDRPEVSSALLSALSSGVSDLVIHGNLGSGKTFATLQCARLLSDRGYRVFRAVNRRSSIAEIDNILKYYSDQPVAMIFENYQRFIEEIEHFIAVRRPGDVCIMSARSPIHELFENFIERVTAKRYIAVDVDRLSFDEIVRLDELLNYAGLWKEHAGRSQAQRIKMAQEGLGASLARVLLEVVRSADIRDRVNDEISPVLEDRQAARLFVAALIVNTMQYEFWVRDWQNFFGVRDLQEVIGRHRDALANFVNLAKAQWTTNSSLLSSEILRGVIGNSQIVDTLTDIFRVADNNRHQDREFDRLRVDLMRYNQIESLFNEKDKSNGLREYYRRIRNIGDIANNPDYWLQYGIVLSVHANLFEEKNVEEADLAFENAYRREGAKQRPNTIRIDNYFARFQLQKAVVMKDHDRAGAIFLDASQKLVRQVFDEEARHYPFKVGRLYTDVAATHFDHWADELQKRFISRCREMVRYAEVRLHEHNNKDVRFLLPDLTKLLAQIDPSRE